MPRLNLAAEVHRARVLAQRRRTIYLLAVGLLLLAVGSFGLAVLLESRVNTRVRALGEEIATVEAQLQARREEVRRILAFRNRLNLLKEKLDTHLGWSKALGDLERLVTPAATFAKLHGSAETGLLTAEVRLPTLDDAADLVASLQSVEKKNETPFESVTVSGARLEEGREAEGYLLTLRLSVLPAGGLFRVTAGVP